MFIKKWKVCEGVKHPPYCLFTRETRALTDLTSYVAQLALYEPKREANTAFRACLPRLAHKAPVMQAKPICRGTVRSWIIQRLLIYYPWCGSVTVDSGWLIKPHRETKAKTNVNITWQTLRCFYSRVLVKFKIFGNLKISYFCFV